MTRRLDIASRKPPSPSAVISHPNHFRSTTTSHTTIAMVLDRLRQLSSHLTSTPPPPHPFDPLSAAEIEHAVAVINEKHAPLAYNAVTLLEPRKREMMAWLVDSGERPHRVADVVAIKKGERCGRAWWI
ncbi:uncharacterized protein KY384_003921 [Bacidia gigantensis]|uniref:uncharacterized protein n=1 Tax=Bacidia gigantensis TaxID=2732470 RepID=UPI001D0598A5|nr:uncharacterized protein KY384_003921 [Bacidia gigantensis]KAG8532280.1 hypothetical protein KY384_003921 [Bacidia gigantensis]